MVSKDHNLSVRQQYKLLSTTQQVVLASPRGAGTGRTCIISQRIKVSRIYGSWKLSASSSWIHSGTGPGRWHVIFTGNREENLIGARNCELSKQIGIDPMLRMLFASIWALISSHAFNNALPDNGWSVTP